MPKHSQTIRVAGRDQATLQALCLATLQDLGWTIDLATEDTLLGRTPRRWNRYDNQVTLDVREEEFTITSEMINGELMDIGGRTKKDVAQFCEAFNKINQQNTGDLTVLGEQLQQLREKTVRQVTQQAEQLLEVEKVMNLSTGSRWLTYGIMVINLGVFLLMAMDGAGIFESNGAVHIRWGSNYGLLTSTGDYWRLITNTFLHFGIIHLAMNIYALYMVGVYLEPMLGKIRFIGAYLATGLLASLASLWWHTEGVNSAGASGAIFGLYGLFLGLLFTKLIPDLVRKSLLSTTVIFVGYNLFYGLKGGVDNAAHIGGLLSGFLIAQFYIPALRREREHDRTAHWQGWPVLAAAVLICFLYLQKNPGNMAERKELEKELINMRSPDYEKFNQQLNRFDQWHGLAQGVLQDSTLTDAALKEKIETVGRGYWKQADQTLEECLRLRVPESQLNKVKTLQEYVALRNQELDLIVSIIDAGDSESRLPELESLRTRAEDKFKQALQY